MYQDPPSSSSQRTQNTANSPPEARDLDRIARLLHYRPANRAELAPIATAVGLRRGAAGVEMIVAHNNTNQSIQATTNARAQAVGAVLRGESDLNTTAASLARNSGLPSSPDPAEVIAKDLKKLKNHATDLKRPILNHAFDILSTNPPPLRDVTVQDRRRGTVHAEMAIDSAIGTGNQRIGVSKLCCQDCFNVLGAAQARGTHGNSYPGWKNPNDQSVLYNSPTNKYINQYASPSVSSGSSPHQGGSPSSSSDGNLTDMSMSSGERPGQFHNTAKIQAEHDDYGQATGRFYQDVFDGNGPVRLYQPLQGHEVQPQTDTHGHPTGRLFQRTEHPLTGRREKLWVAPVAGREYLQPPYQAPKAWQQQPWPPQQQPQQQAQQQALPHSQHFQPQQQHFQPPQQHFQPPQPSQRSRRK